MSSCSVVCLGVSCKCFVEREPLEANNISGLLSLTDAVTEPGEIRFRLQARIVDFFANN